MKGSRITNCFLCPRDDQRVPMFEAPAGSNDGRIWVNLDRYAIVPREMFDGLQEVAERHAAREAAEALAAIRHATQPVRPVPAPWYRRIWARIAGKAST